MGVAPCRLRLSGHDRQGTLSTYALLWASSELWLAGSPSPVPAIPPHALPCTEYGCKTSTILDHLHDARPESCVCLNFFFDFRDKDKQHLDNLLRSLAFQLYSQCTDGRKDLDALFTSCDDGRHEPRFDVPNTWQSSVNQPKTENKLWVAKKDNNPPKRRRGTGRAASVPQSPKWIAGWKRHA